MDSIKLDLAKSSEAPYFFLRSLWDCEAKKFAGNGIGLGAFLNFASGGFEFDCEWRRSYVAVMDKPWASEAFLSPDQCFRIMIDLVARYRKKYKFDLFQVESLLHSMCEAPAQNQEKLMLWRHAVEDALTGKKSEGLLRHYFSDWYGK